MREKRRVFSKKKGSEEERGGEGELKLALFLIKKFYGV